MAGYPANMGDVPVPDILTFDLVLKITAYRYRMSKLTSNTSSVSDPDPYWLLTMTMGLNTA